MTNESSAKINQGVSVALVREFFSYNPKTGFLRWRKHRPGMELGAIAGTKQATGHVVISVNGRRLYAHRIVWAIATGSWPVRHVDHIDGDASNNKLRNLREATSAQNAANRKRRFDNSSGYKGVHLCKESNLWRASIMKNGKTYYLGRHATPEAAHAAYCKSAGLLHGEFARAS